MSFTEQPIELVLRQLEFLPIQEVLNICESNSQLAQICNTRDFWFSRLPLDFPDENVVGEPNPKSRYLQLYQEQKQART